MLLIGRTSHVRAVMFLYRLNFDCDLSTVTGGDYGNVTHFEQLVFCCSWRLCYAVYKCADNVKLRNTKTKQSMHTKAG